MFTADKRSTRGLSRALICVAGVAVVAGCRDSVGPRPLPPLPQSFVFVSGGAGFAQIQRWYADSVVALTTGPGENIEPTAAANRLAFTSYRDGNAEIYLANLDGTDQHRVITSAAFDVQPQLSPDATRLVFVSTRTGAQRLYVADSSGANVAALLTGSAANVPETSPAWSPNAQQIAFTSSRTGTSQVYVVAASGGEATPLTQEAVGAFEPAWSARGDTLFYVAAEGTTAVRAVRLSDKSRTTFPGSENGYREPTCATFGCVVVRSTRANGSGELVALQSNGRRVAPLFAGDSTNRNPTLIR